MIRPLAQRALVGFVLLSGSMTFAQNQQVGKVLVTVTVTDVYGRWISGLEKENIKIYEGKLEREALTFSKDSDPVSVGIIVDKSGSASSPLYKKIDIPLSLFLHRANHKNEYFLMTFNEKQKLLRDWTPDFADIENDLNELSSIEAKKNTKFFDALAIAVDKFGASRYPRKALLVISDGQDNGSDHRLKDIKEKLKGSDITVYCVTPVLPQDAGNPLGMSGQSNLDSLVQLTGGKSFYPLPNELNEVVFRIAEELDYQYVLEIEPSSQDAKWHDLDVRLTAPDEMKKVGKLIVRTRKGYFTGQAK